jgi:hypothetical protein
MTGGVRIFVRKFGAAHRGGPGAVTAPGRAGGLDADDGGQHLDHRRRQRGTYRSRGKLRRQGLRRSGAGAGTT